MYVHNLPYIHCIYICMHLHLYNSLFNRICLDTYATYACVHGHFFCICGTRFTSLRRRVHWLAPWLWKVTGPLDGFSWEYACHQLWKFCCRVSLNPKNELTHTHTCIYIYIYDTYTYTYIYACVKDLGNGQFILGALGAFGIAQEHGGLGPIWRQRCWRAKDMPSQQTCGTRKGHSGGSPRACHVEGENAPRKMMTIMIYRDQ